LRREPELTVAGAKSTEGHLATADISDSAGAYDRTRLMDAAAYQYFVLEIVRRTDEEAGFKLLPKR
jgi:hypothetical protein